MNLEPVLGTAGLVAISLCIVLTTGILILIIHYGGGEDPLATKDWPPEWVDKNKEDSERDKHA